MQTSGLPNRVAVPFADSGTKNTIPVASQIGITGGAASYTTGFPPLTMTPISAGGIPPFGADFNGILNAITVALRWNTAGAGYPFDSAFSTTVSGYPKGARLPSSDSTGYWLNTIESNTTNPENSTSAITGWVPDTQYGTTSITGLASSSITLTTLQAAKSVITLAGTLTANISISFPAWIKTWKVINNCTGAFSVTCKTISGTGIPIASGVTARILSDGVNIAKNFGSAANVDVGTASTNIPDMSSFASVLAQPGYQRLPGGFIIQWGTAAVPIAGSVTVSFPLAITAGYMTLVAPIDTSSTNNYRVGISTSTNTSITLASTNTSSITGVMWQSIGKL